MATSESQIPRHESRFVQPLVTVDRKVDKDGKLTKTPELPRPKILDILADRYASIEALLIFEPNQSIVDERDLWVIVMQCQRELGANIPQNLIEAYKVATKDVDFEAIRNRERELRHDEKAKLEAFNNAARKYFVPNEEGPEFEARASQAMTSRDTSDPVEQARFRRGLMLMRDRTVATLARLSRLAIEHSALTYANRSHNAVAQPDFIGRMFCCAADDLLFVFEDLENFIEDYPFRGLKGAIGTQTDQITYLGSKEKAAKLEKMVAEALGFNRTYTSTGQEYPRTLDFMAVAKLYALICPLNSLAKTFRLMAGNEQFTEGFKEGQVGSVAMPFKMNSRSAERLDALFDNMKGELTKAAAIAGKQWYVGDVSASATRRIMILAAVLTVDASFQTMLTVLDECGFYPKVIAREVERCMPFLTATRVLQSASRKGVGRETVHTIIKDHAIAVAKEMRFKGIFENDLFDRLAADPRLKLTRQEIDEATQVSEEELVGSAPEQIKEMVGKISKITERYPEAAKYVPEEIL